MQTTLGDRASVGVVVEHSANGLPQSVRVVLTYAFGASISRTGRLELPLVASDVPTHVIALLSDLHATPITPTLSETQKYAKEAAWSASARPLPVPVSSDATTRSHDPTNLIGEGGPDASTSTHSQVLKRRLVPSGIVYVTRRVGTMDGRDSKYVTRAPRSDGWLLFTVWCRRRKGPKGAKLAKS